jgi:hypothetical protein
MGYILSCGHREDDEEKHYSITTKEWVVDESGWNKALSYKTVCQPCYKKYEKEGNLCYSDEEAFEWLHNDKEN